MEENIKKIKQFRETILLTQDERASMDEAIFSFMKMHPLEEAHEPAASDAPGHNTKPSGFVFWHVVFQKRFAYGALVGVLIVSLFAGTASAAEHALPGDVLYPVKVNVTEEIRSRMLISQKQKAQWEVERVRRRLTEIQTLVASQGAVDPAVVVQLEKYIQKHSEKVNQALASFEEAGDTATIVAIADNLDFSLESYRSVVSSADQKNTRDTANNIQTVFDTVEKTQQRARAAQYQLSVPFPVAITTTSDVAFLEPNEPEILSAPTAAADTTIPSEPSPSLQSLESFATLEPKVYASVWIHVVDTEGNEISGSNIRLENGERLVAHKGFNGLYGMFFSDVAEGAYSVFVTPNGYTQEFMQSFSVSSGERREVRFEIDTKRTESVSDNDPSNNRAEFVTSSPVGILPEKTVIPPVSTFESDALLPTQSNELWQPQSQEYISVVVRQTHRDMSERRGEKQYTITSFDIVPEGDVTLETMMVVCRPARAVSAFQIAHDEAVVSGNVTHDAGLGASFLRVAPSFYFEKGKSGNIHLVVDVGATGLLPTCGVERSKDLLFKEKNTGNEVSVLLN